MIPIRSIFSINFEDISLCCRMCPYHTKGLCFPPPHRGLFDMYSDREVRPGCLNPDPVRHKSPILTQELYLQFCRLVELFAVIIHTLTPLRQKVMKSISLLWPPKRVCFANRNIGQFFVTNIFYFRISSSVSFFNCRKDQSFRIFFHFKCFTDPG